MAGGLPENSIVAIIIFCKEETRISEVNINKTKYIYRKRNMKIELLIELSLENVSSSPVAKI